MEKWLPYIIGSGLALGGLSTLVYNFIRGAYAEKEAAKKAKTVVDEALEKAQGALVGVIKEEVEAWKARHKFEHEELLQARIQLDEYRTTAHAKRNEMNKQVLDLTVEIAECRAKTDMTPVFEFQHEQTLINKKVMESLNVGLRSLKAIAHHLSVTVNGDEVAR